MIGAPESHDWGGLANLNHTLEGIGAPESHGWRGDWST
ncbi:unnamed protein product [Staurois parvus]|uniref:Uncharacterized protein n=1 Tax=Staurois parvus TaxID=386267 RepID=A0ABN9GVT4_9NEOB|nr:unnamed protein product [Staurois parvus]